MPFWIYVFLLCSTYTMYLENRHSNLKPLLHFWDKPYVAMIFLKYCGIQAVTVLVGMFASTLVPELNLQPSFCVTFVMMLVPRAVLAL